MFSEEMYCITSFLSHQYKELREQYDIGCVQCTNHTQLVSLTRKFLLFYSESKDHPRLVRNICPLLFQLLHVLLFHDI